MVARGDPGVRGEIVTPDGDVAHGTTGWRRFAVVFGAATVVAGGIVVGMANGAIAASFAVSGSTFKVSASNLDGTGFVQYGGIASEKGARMLPDGRPDPTDPKNHPVAVSGIADATLADLCQSVTVPGLPVSLMIRAGGGGTPAKASGLIIDATQLNGDATFRNISIGQDASTLSKAGAGVAGATGGFGQQADSVHIDKLRQVAWSTSAGTFTLNGLDLRVSVRPGGTAEECF
jgi:hypothetical protein